MTRSKSPKARANGGFDINDANVQLAITSAAICAVAYFYDGDGTFDHNTLTEFFSGEHAIPYWPFGGFVMTLHCLNTCQNAGKGFWVGSFVNAWIACFGGAIMTAVLTGNAASLAGNEANATLVFVCWYLTNHDLPVVGTDVWGAVSGAGGGILASIMDLCSLCVTTGWIMAAVNAGSASTPGWFGNSWFVPMAFGAMAGCAGDFFPLNKGLKFKNGPAMERAMMISFFLCSNGFSNFPVVGDAIGNVTGQLAGHFGGNEGFVMTVTILNHLFGHFLPIDPCAGAVDFLYKISGLNRG